MNPSEWTIRPLTGAELEAMYHAHMERDFPPDELKPLELLVRLIGEGINSVYGCFEGEELIGYYVLARWSESRMVLLDYLAVIPERRGTGVGSYILSSVKKGLEPEAYLFIESENPAYADTPEERETRQRRLRFYHRAGAVEKGVEVLLFGVQYIGLTLCCGSIPTASQQTEAYLELYRHMLPPDWYEKNVKARIQ